MTKIKDIERAISKLPREDLAALRKWFLSFDQEQWDRQLKDDVASGRLERLSKKALADFEEGRCKDL